MCGGRGAKICTCVRVRTCVYVCVCRLTFERNGANDRGGHLIECITMWQRSVQVGGGGGERGCDQKV